MLKRCYWTGRGAGVGEGLVGGSGRGCRLEEVAAVVVVVEGERGSYRMEQCLWMI